MKQIFTTYWGGYFKNNIKYPQTLDLIPNYIDIVILAFIGPLKDSSVETTFLCSIYSEEQIKEWICECQNKNIKVFFSILDTPETHWDQIDLKIFAKNLKKVMDEWKIDGIDIDAESGMPSDVYIENFINLATCIKNEIGNKSLIYTCYTGTEGPDGKILSVIKNKLDFIQLMAYFDDYNEMIDLYNDYKQIMNDNIVIGVKAGNPDITPIDEVKKLCLWNKNKKGIMLWTINRDTPQYTNMPLLTWASTIYQSISKPILLNLFDIKSLFSIFNFDINLFN
jgi:hypothetical protein